MAIPLRQRVQLDELALTGEMTYGEYVEIKRKRRERSMSVLRSVQRGSKGSKRVRMEPRTAKGKGQASKPDSGQSEPDYEGATMDMHVPDSNDAAAFHDTDQNLRLYSVDLGERESPIQEYAGTKGPSRSGDGDQYTTTEESPMPELSHTLDTEGTPPSDLSDIHNTTVTELPGTRGAKGDSLSEMTGMYHEDLMSDRSDSRGADEALSYFSDNGGEAGESTPQTPGTQTGEATHTTPATPSTAQGPADWSKLSHNVGEDSLNDNRNDHSSVSHYDNRHEYDDVMSETFDYSVFHSPTPEPFQVSALPEGTEERESVGTISDNEEAIEEPGQDDTPHMDHEAQSDQEIELVQELGSNQEADMSEGVYSNEAASLHREAGLEVVLPDEVEHEAWVEAGIATVEAVLDEGVDREANSAEGTDLVHEMISKETDVVISDQETDRENGSESIKTSALGEKTSETIGLDKRATHTTDMSETDGLVLQADETRTSRSPEAESIEEEVELINTSVFQNSDNVQPTNADATDVQEAFDSKKLSFKSPRIKTPLFLTLTPKTTQEHGSDTEKTHEDGSASAESGVERDADINPLSQTSDLNKGAPHAMAVHTDDSESEETEKVFRVGKLSFKSPKIKQPVYFNLNSRVTHESTFDRETFPSPGSDSDNQESDDELQPGMEEVLEKNTSEPLNDVGEERLSDIEREPDVQGKADTNASTVEDANDMEVENQDAHFPGDLHTEQTEKQDEPLAGISNTKQATVVEALPEPMTDMAALTEGVALDALFDEFPEDDSFSDDPQDSPSPSYSSRAGARLSSISQGASDDEDLFPADVFSHPDAITSDVDIDEREIGLHLKATNLSAKAPELLSRGNATVSHETPAECMRDSHDGMQSLSEEELEAAERAVPSLEKKLLSTSNKSITPERVTNLADVTNSMTPSNYPSRTDLSDLNSSRMSPLKHVLEEEEDDVLEDSNGSRHKRIRIGTDGSPFKGLNDLVGLPGLPGDSQTIVEMEPASDSTSSSREPARLHEGFIVSGGLAETTSTFGRFRRFSPDRQENDDLESAQPPVQGAARLSMINGRPDTMTDAAAFQSPIQDNSFFRGDIQTHQDREHEQTSTTEGTELSYSFSGSRSGELEDGRLEASDSHNQDGSESRLTVAHGLAPEDQAPDKRSDPETVSQDTSPLQGNVGTGGENTNENESEIISEKSLPSPELGEITSASPGSDDASPQNGLISQDNIEHFINFEDGNIEEEGNAHGPSYGTPDYGPEEIISSVPEEVDEGPEEPLYETYAGDDEFVAASGDELDAGYASDVDVHNGYGEASEEDVGHFGERYSSQEDLVDVQDSNIELAEEHVGDSIYNSQEQRNDTEDAGNDQVATPPSSDMGSSNANRSDFAVDPKREETPEMPMDSSPTPSVARSVRRSSNAFLSDRQDVNIIQHRSTPSLDLIKPALLSPQGSDSHEAQEDSLVEENSLVTFNPTENWTKLHWRELERSLIHEERRSNINLKFNLGTTYDVDYDKIIQEFRHNVQVPGDFFDEATLVKRIKALQIRRARDVVRWSRGITPHSAKVRSRMDNSLRYLSLSIKRVAHFDHLDDRSFDDSILNDTFNT